MQLSIKIGLQNLIWVYLMWKPVYKQLTCTIVKYLLVYIIRIFLSIITTCRSGIFQSTEYQLPGCYDNYHRNPGTCRGAQSNPSLPDAIRNLHPQCTNLIFNHFINKNFYLNCNNHHFKLWFIFNFYFILIYEEMNKWSNRYPKILIKKNQNFYFTLNWKFILILVIIRIKVNFN